MPRTAPGLRADATPRLVELARQRPEWQAWINLLDLAWRAVGDDRWGMPLDLAEADLSSSASADHAPLLNGRTLRVDAARLRRLIKSLASAAQEGPLDGAQSLHRYQPSDEETLELVAAAITQKRDAVASVARERGIHEDALAAIAQLGALPVLQACARQLETQQPHYWPAGYCPICGAWPVLAERRGLDRSRRLRCGRCAADWEVEWLYCIYCGERQHSRLGSLAADENGDMLKIETCISCRSYLKSIASLQSFPAFELLLRDLETVELDLVALERGYGRPLTAGFPLAVQVVNRASR